MKTSTIETSPVCPGFNGHGFAMLKASASTILQNFNRMTLRNLTLGILTLVLIATLCFTDAYAAEATSAIGRQIASFELNDIQGQPHKLDDWKASPVVVVVFLGTECPLAKQYAPRLQELADKYAEQKVALLVVSSNQQDSITELSHFARTSGLKVPILKDLGTNARCP
jgi:thiol-disulfide isomerase/thioredoxin